MNFLCSNCETEFTAERWNKMARDVMGKEDILTIEEGHEMNIPWKCPGCGAAVYQPEKKEAD